ncbi:MAG: 2-haloacrylate reductase [Burkholderia lata]|uniref:2-haloacrylate reductase n=1 Tax=Burkholderia lata (strain ATCC 17760 / DSM 23089 / LMG 22485 / NCIMB 9086 / R18194 / 383) TaxID=482957 RepID=A0A833PQF1_BURL3|nr:quinone oxidoreductase [Burkholderia lata]KAF1035324.1 MAG: 2-haloacrylate reductase [Burkholderia lata]
MAVTVRIAGTGDVEVLECLEVGRERPGPGEVWLEQEAIGVNPLDLNQRRGDAPVTLPSGLGLEGAGIVAEVGDGVADFRVGDRVGYATGPLGAYASGRRYPAERLVALPDAVSFDDAAAVLFKGITAQYLLTTTFPVRDGSVVVIYGAAGALGQIMVPWAKHLGAHVIGVVSRSESVERARQAGCDHVLVFDAATLGEQVTDITEGRKADVVYDGVGKVSFDASLDCLRPRGLMVSFGATSGAPSPVSVSTLNAKGSLYLTRPSLAAHTASADVYRQRAHAVLDAIRAGFIRANPRHIFPLADVRKAHALLQQGKTEGAVILKP